MLCPIVFYNCYLSSLVSAFCQTDLIVASAASRRSVSAEVYAWQRLCREASARLVAVPRGRVAHLGERWGR